MKKVILILVVVLFVAMAIYGIGLVHADPGTLINYGNFNYNLAYQAQHFPDVWDLTKGDLTLSYTLDTSLVTAAGWPDGPWPEVGIRQLGAADYNSIGVGGYMVSFVADLTPSPGNLYDNDKHNLCTAPGNDETRYDCTDPSTIVGPFGTNDNYGIWFDRDTVDQWQAGYWGAVNGGTYNTGGVYNIVISYHAISPTLGTMFATVNGIQTGFYTSGWKDAQPDIYPAGLSFTGDMTHMQVFAGVADYGYMWGDISSYGQVNIRSLTVTGELATCHFQVFQQVIGWPGSPTTLVDEYDSYNTPVSYTELNTYGANYQWICTGFTGTGSAPASGTSNSVAFNILVDSTVTFYLQRQALQTFDASANVKTDGTGTILTVTYPYFGVSTTDTVAAVGGLPHSVWADSYDGTLTYSFSSTVGSSVAGKQYRLDSVSGPASGYDPSTSCTVTATYVTQYHLTVNVSPPGAATIAGTGWFDSGASKSLTAPAGGPGYGFLNWDLDGTPQGPGTNPLVVSMTGPHTATAHYYPGGGVGGEWAPIDMVQVVSPWIALIFIGLAFAAAGSHRLLKKRL